MLNTLVKIFYNIFKILFFFYYIYNFMFLAFFQDSYFFTFDNFNVSLLEKVLISLDKIQTYEL